MSSSTWSADQYPKPTTEQLPLTTSISPAIHYWGTPVVLLSTLNPPSTTIKTNIAPLSSAWFLDNRCLIGLGPSSQSAQNLLLTWQCVLNLPSSAMVNVINRLARTTGSEGMSDFKRRNGYVYCEDKWARAGLTAVESEIVEVERVGECPAQMEGRVLNVLGGGKGEGIDGEGNKREFIIFEIEILRTHVHEEIRMVGHENRIDPLKWRPMIMSFQELFGLDGKVGESVLAEIPEEEYR